MSEGVLEVIVRSVDDARQAEAGGARRLEVLRDLDCGGLTPPIELVHGILEAVSIPVRVMIRENEGYRIEHPAELDRLRLLAAQFGALPIDGLVLGFLLGGKIDNKSTSAILRQVPLCRATFHHAFEETDDAQAAIYDLKHIPQIDRILTAGRSGTWAQRRARIEQYYEQARPELTILAGGDVTLTTMGFLLRTTPIREFHVGRAARQNGRVRAQKVAGLVRLLKTPAAAQTE